MAEKLPKTLRRVVCRFDTDSVDEYVKQTLRLLEVPNDEKSAKHNKNRIKLKIDHATIQPN